MISVIIPVFNTGKSCIKLVQKILQVANSGIEIIIIDDASTDDSLKLLNKEFSNEKKIKILRQPKNLGASAARNRGLEIIKGNYVVFLDSDDMITDNYFDEMLTLIKQEQVILGVCGIEQKYLASDRVVRRFDKLPEKRRNDESLKKYILRLMVADAHLYSTVNKIYRADIIRRYKLQFDERLNFAEDTTFVLNYLEKCPENGEINFTTKALYVYNYGTETSLISESALRWENWRRNYDFIKDWSNHEGEKYLRSLYLRFKISHALAVARAKKNWREKTKYLSPLALILALLITKLRKQA